jgi:hypothetical protein
VEGSGKVVCIQAMMTYRGSGDTVPLINLGWPGCFGEEINFFPLLGFGT